MVLLGSPAYSNRISESTRESRKGATMLLSPRTRFRASALVIALVVAAGSDPTDAASPDKSPSLAEYIRSICSAAIQPSSSMEAPFISENVNAMTEMLVGMQIKPSGDVDYDFAAMMIPHHQGAIDMAQAELRHGRNERLRRIAQEIIVEQQQEISAMRMALGQPLPPSVATPDQQSDQPDGAEAQVPARRED